MFPFQIGKLTQKKNFFILQQFWDPLTKPYYDILKANSSKLYFANLFIKKIISDVLISMGWL